MKHSDSQEHACNVSGMFGRIAGCYDFLNHFLSGGMDYWWRHQLVRQITPGATGKVLDLAAGTYDVSLEIRRQHPQMQVAALDYCLPMLTTGKKKLKNPKGVKVYPVQADGRSLPLADGSVDCATIAFGIRNIIPREEAFREILRVLQPGGRLCVLEFGSGKNKVWKGLYNFYLQHALPVIGKIFSGDDAAYKYLADTIIAFPDAGELAMEMRQAGFERVYHRPLTSGIVQLHVAQKAFTKE